MDQQYLDKAMDETKRTTPFGIVQILADKYKRLDDAKRRIDEEGLIVRDQKGSVIEHPALKIITTHEKEILDILKQYGER